MTIYQIFRMPKFTVVSMLFFRFICFKMLSHSFGSPPDRVISSWKLSFLVSNFALAVEIFILRLYVLIVWNIIVLYQLLLKRRDCWIRINDLRVVHEEQGFVVINKHPELLINCTNPWVNCLTLQMQLFYNRPQYVNWKLKNMFHFVHRLDCPTSGLICIAYDTKVASMIRRAFEKREVTKYYLAIVWGYVGSLCDINPSFVKHESKFVHHVHMPIGSFRYIWPDTGRKQKITVPNTHPECYRPRESLTTIIVLGYGKLMGEPATRVLLIPKTGRRHQLRVHCAVGLGHPIAGDITYVRRPFDHPNITYIHDIYAMHDVNLDYKLKHMMLHAYSMKIKLQIKNNKADNMISHQLPKMKEYQFHTDDNPFFDVNDAYLWEKDEESKGIVMATIMDTLEGCI
ncbi:RNA pseudouridylate synthase domain-containing protein 1 [Schistosoma japonicum]|nr:RNA pseudouridylate synthase domain-containing protein 1 [Schistosoma japonicum]